MKQFIEPTIEILEIEVEDIICESVQYFQQDDYVGWG